MRNHERSCGWNLLKPCVRSGLLLFALFVATGGVGQEAKRRFDVTSQIRRDKFDHVLPQVMRENGIDMWITVIREGHYDPLYEDLGKGFASIYGYPGYYIFTDRGGDRIERATLGIGSYELRRGGAYDIFAGSADLKAFVEERDPEKIAINMAEHVGAADGISLTDYRRLVSVLGEPYASRLVSAEKLISDFRSRRVTTEVAVFAEAGDLARRIAERALTNEVITPGVTTLEDVAWWMQDRLMEQNLVSSFGMPAVYTIEPEGLGPLTTDRIIQRGDLLTIDWGVGLMNLFTDMKRIAYVLEEGETTVPAGIQNAFEQALKVREIIRKTIIPGRSGVETLELLNRRIEEAGFVTIKREDAVLEVLGTFASPNDGPETDVLTLCHSVGNLGHGIGPSVASFNPKRLQFEIRPTNLLSIELFAWTPAPEWGGKKVHIHLEDDAVVTERGVEWLYPVNSRILVVK